MQTTDNSSRPDLFGLLNTWAKLLPKEGEYNATSAANLFKVGNEIKQFCAEVEQNGGFPQSSIPPKEIKPESVGGAKNETVFKPTFVFQLETDATTNADSRKFACVYDFCQALEEHCKNSPNHHLDIEEDWLKLLLSCSPHNYDRFMWIHTTFQAVNNLKLDWTQVKKRLMCKYDDPSRHMAVQKQISSFKYIPKLESIEVANQNYNRLAKEAQVNFIDPYINGLPSSVRNVIISTMGYDKTTTFKYDLKDIQQRAVVFVSANECDFVFYSKSAHVAVKLEHEKVSQKDCEFHLLQDHSTSTCPDYTIVKYPYMDFTPLADVPQPDHGILAITAPPAVNGTLSASSQSPPITVTPGSTNQAPADEVMAPPQPMTVPQAYQQQQQQNGVPLPPPVQLPVVPEPSLPSPVAVAEPIPTMAHAPSSTFVTTQVKKEPDQTYVEQRQQQVPQASHPVEQMATNFIANVIATANQTNQTTEQAKALQAARAQIPEEIAKLNTMEVVNMARDLAAKGEEIPIALKLRILDLKNKFTYKLNTTAATSVPTMQAAATPLVSAGAPIPTPIQASLKVTRSVSPALSRHRFSRRSESPSSRHRSSRRGRSPSPKRSRHHHSRSRSRSRSSSPEIGCYYHGENASHTTKSCRQAQMVIPSHERSNRRRSASPPLRRGGGKSGKRRGEDDEEENICIFCREVFLPGHLRYCTKVVSRKKR
jgi:hypothetical protein